MVLSKKIILTWFVGFFLCSPAFSQKKVFICFTDKGPETAKNISVQQQWLKTHFTAEALERRALRGSVTGFTRKDYPLYQPYVNELADKGIRIIHQLRWLNAVSAVIAEKDQRVLIKMPFIKEILPVRSFIRREPDIQISHSPAERPATENVLDQVIAFVNAASLKASGVSGNGVRVGVFDTGFEINIPAMEHIRRNTIDTYDFIYNDTIVYNETGESYSTSSHGTSVSSVIGGFHQITEYTFEGLAPDVSFLLYKTEDVRSETHLEEDNWAAAAERAEMMGADIVSSSLGYSTFDAGEENYTYEDMDGETTIITRAANILTEYGVIVVTSAGNEGANSWNYITAPADGFDVIAVGAVYLDGKMAPFSSYGPTVDGRLKPEVVAPGVSVPCINNAGGLSYGSGTSLAAPVVTGGIALMLEMVPDMTMEEFREALFSTSSLSKLKDEPEEPDNRHGYGIPQFEELFDEIKPIHLPEIGQGMKIYPNPVSNRGNFFVSFSFPLQHNMQLEIYNILGQQVSVRSVMKGTLVAEITDSRFFQLPSGIYIISAQINGKRYSQKIVRIK